MPKTIPEVTLRNPVEDDIKRITFVFSNDPDTGDDVINASVVYQLVDDGEVVFDASTGFNKVLTAGAVFNNVIALRDGPVINAILAEEGFS